MCEYGLKSKQKGKLSDNEVLIHAPLYKQIFSEQHIK